MVLAPIALRMNAIAFNLCKSESPAIMLAFGRVSRGLPNLSSMARITSTHNALSCRDGTPRVVGRGRLGRFRHGERELMVQHHRTKGDNACKCNYEVLGAYRWTRVNDRKEHAQLTSFGLTEVRFGGRLNVDVSLSMHENCVNLNVPLTKRPEIQRLQSLSFLVRLKWVREIRVRGCRLGDGKQKIKDPPIAALSSVRATMP